MLGCDSIRVSSGSGWVACAQARSETTQTRNAQADHRTALGMTVQILFSFLSPCMDDSGSPVSSSLLSRIALTVLSHRKAPFAIQPVTFQEPRRLLWREVHLSAL